ncbi:hypothetical protein PV05_09014 [Exophiala xenobiotica]|uniref:Uncharacterized protein n=1 Tax=Exophiala xenobiotica TaxID=348802 RepID=A0A0D2BLN0_9EURO|nr:uncharacterized protein PV05_09014 [Exophiala xenobiotica]KIW53441.1 hypothetical protein PV05_09014 [Exophiala xenobiotica]
MCGCCTLAEFVHLHSYEGPCGYIHLLQKQSGQGGSSPQGPQCVNSNTKPFPRLPRCTITRSHHLLVAPAAPFSLLTLIAPPLLRVQLRRQRSTVTSVYRSFFVDYAVSLGSNYPLPFTETWQLRSLLRPAPSPRSKQSVGRDAKE